MKINEILTLVTLFTLFLSKAESAPLYPDMYNVVWTSQSENAAGSMPVGGGDIGLNVWVEDNDLLLYMQRSGVHDEYNGFPKLGRVRIWSEPNIFDGATSFRQELKLSESCVEISADHPEHGTINFRIWVEVNHPKIHIECESSKAINYFSQYESWRTMPRSLSIGDENEKDRWGWWDTGGWAHEVILEPDHFKQDRNKFTFYHINPEEKLTSKLAYGLMGMEDHYGNYYDPLKDAVWGGQMSGSNLVFNKITTGKYSVTDYTGWQYKSANPSKKQDLNFWFHNSHCGSGENGWKKSRTIKKI